MPDYHRYKLLTDWDWPAGIRVISAVLAPSILRCPNTPQTTMARHVIIVGGGRVGRHTAEQLSEDRYTVTIIERDSEKCTQLAPTVSQVIEGDGTDPDIFSQADPTTADVVAALTNDTEVNLAICEMAHETVSDVRTVLRIARDGEQDYGHRNFVDQIVYPEAAGADVAVDRITRVGL